MQATTLKATFALVGIFIAGTVAGGFSGIAWERHNAKRISAQAIVDSHMRRLMRDLELTGEQEKCIRPIMQEFVEELRTARRAAWSQMDQVIGLINARIETELTPDQLNKFREIQAMQRERREKEQKLRSPQSGHVEPHEKPPPS